MKKLLQSKTGVTVLEGIIALGLLAVVTAGSFGVLLSVSRQATQPDMREEMALAVEKANDKLKALLLFTDTDLSSLSAAYLPSEFSKNSIHALCPNDANVANPFTVDQAISIKCLLPPICDNNSSEFTYTIATRSASVEVEDVPVPDSYQITYDITCNGFKL